MSNTNHFSQGFSAIFPDSHKGSIYLTKNIIRKCVEQSEWLIGQKESDKLDLHEDATTIAGADETNGENTLYICRKYGAVRGALHYDDIALDRIDERITNMDLEIEMLQNFVTQMKAAYKTCTGDTFLAKDKPKGAVPAKRSEELRKKYAS